MLNQLLQHLFPVPDSIATKFFKNFERITLKRGDFLIKEADYSSSLFVIESGLVRQYAWSEKGGIAHGFELFILAIKRVLKMRTGFQQCSVNIGELCTFIRESVH